MAASRSPLDDHRARWPGLPDDERVRAIAARIIRDLEIDAAPVPLRMVASHLDIRDIEEVDDLSEAGCLIVGPNGARVRLRGSDSPQRKRFTIGHECGHTFHARYGDIPRYRCNPLATQADEIERLCDTAASALLLPRRLLTRDIEGAPFGRAQVTEMSALYEASLTATALALIDCHLYPAGVLVFEIARAPREAAIAEPKLRLRWAVARGSWPFFRTHKSVDDGDVFHRALEGEVVHERTTIRGITRHPVEADVDAWRADYGRGPASSARVIAVVGRPWDSRPADG